MSILYRLHVSRLRIWKGTWITAMERRVSVEFTHFNEQGEAQMVDVSEKADTYREAVAAGYISMNEACYKLAKTGSNKKGDILGVARIAGIMAMKKTAELIPLCHNIPISKAEIQFEYDDANHRIKAVGTVWTCDKTGVEMEAMTGVQIALLTIYDMCKAADKFMVIHDVCLVKKNGGKSGLLINPNCQSVE